MAKVRIQTLPDECCARCSYWRRIEGEVDGFCWADPPHVFWSESEDTQITCRPQSSEMEICRFFKRKADA